MTQSSSRSSRRVSALFFSAWTLLALSLAFAFAAATWVQCRHVSLVAALTLPLLVLCGLAAIALLARSYRDIGRPWTRRLVVWLAPALMLGLGGAAVWAVLPSLSRLDLFPLKPTGTSTIGLDFSDWGDLEYLHSQWGSSFEHFQLAMFVTAAVLTLLMGLATFLLCRLRSAPDAMLRRRLFVVVLLAILTPAALVFGGYEASRRAGMVAFLEFHQDDIDALMAQCLRYTPEVVREWWRADYQRSNRGEVILPGAVAYRDYAFSPTEGPVFEAWIALHLGPNGQGQGFERMSSDCTLSDAQRQQIAEGLEILWLRLPLGQWDEWTGWSYELPQFISNHSICIPVPAKIAARTDDEERVLFGGPGVDTHPLWGQWRESGPTLTFDFPPQQDCDWFPWLRGLGLR